MPYILSIDQGTSSTRCLLFNESIEIVSTYQLEHKQIYPQSGYVEHDAIEIWNNVQVCINRAVESVMNASDHKVSLEHKIMAIGITNQRETCLFWHKSTGQPYAHAIVWNDTRTASVCNQLAEEYRDAGGKFKYQRLTGLPISTYFSLTKIMYLFDTIPGLRHDAAHGEALFGTMDSFLIWKLTNGAVHATDVTNASRTMLMNIASLQWDESILNEFDIPIACLPTIRPSSYVYGKVVSAGHDLLKCIERVPIGGVLGDQQAALFGQVCFDVGDAKCTYGTGAFLLMNTGQKLIYSTQGLLTTVAYQLSEFQAPVYAIEGSIAYSGSTIQWLRDNLNIIPSLHQCEEVARTVTGSEGVFLVPAFSGLYAPHWRLDARGVIVGLTAYHNKGHIVRAALEATAYQVNDVLEAMKYDAKIKLLSMKVDGGQTKNSLLMQFQADIVNVPLSCPLISETTSLGACFVAGLAVQLWQSTDELKRLYKYHRSWKPDMNHNERVQRKKQWNKAINRTLDWIPSSSSSSGLNDDDDVDNDVVVDDKGDDNDVESGTSKLSQGKLASGNQVSTAMEDDDDKRRDKHNHRNDIHDHDHRNHDHALSLYAMISYRPYLITLAVGVGIGIALHQLLPGDIFRFKSSPGIQIKPISLVIAPAKL